MKYTYNATLLEAYSCPRRGYLLREAMLTAKDGHLNLANNEFAAQGTRDHDFAAKYIRHCRDKKLITDVMYPEELGLTGVDLEHAVKFVSCVVVPIDSGCEIEKRLSFPPFFGTPDLVVYNHHEVVVHDWKFSQNALSQEEFDERIQLKLYSYLLMQDGASPDIFKTKYVYPLLGGFEVGHDYIPEEVYGYGLWLENLVKQYDNSTDQTPKPGKSCGYCEFSTTCPEILKLPIKEITTEQQALDMARIYLASKSVVSKLEPMLKAYCKDGKRIPLEGGELGYHPGHTRKYFPDSGAVVDLLRDNDIPPERVWELVSIPVGEAFTLCGEDKILKDQMNKLVVKKPEEWFKFQKPKKEKP